MNKFVRNIPNYITCIRIIGSGFLFWLTPISLWWFIVYVICGLSDILDGVLARKLKVTSRFGSILDSLSDWFFYIAMASGILPYCFRLYNVANWIMIITAVTFHLAAYVVCFVRFKKFSALHTYANKAMSFLIFLLPFSFIGEINILYSLYAYIGGGIAIYSSIEINVIHFLARDYDERNKSIFLLKNNRFKRGQ